ncbi:factor 2-alpha kinase 1 [Seminavis robusta]|uniref:non-specific serine/threonine protein kinase n=1 Tax=Seminavis robusta TaxID=568900 RepID=A0A9N8HH90_9STRA|nr:factor 2-alpha kinase 1 [Seminavis robusta]|eukprot:Sro524_g160010.1 factor 2-alpha kinase 1 (895) ;mRNA; r:35408-38092
MNESASVEDEEKTTKDESSSAVKQIAKNSLNSSNKSNGSKRIRKIPIVTTPTRGFSGASSSDDDDLDDDDDDDDDDEGMERKGSSGQMKIPSFHNSRGAPVSSANNEAPSSPQPSNSTGNNNNPGNTAVQPDQERQILLLMLLAQVCALHDPTPRTFTVHVLELFERGILGRQSIHFLFELGLVPPNTPRMLTAHPHNNSNNNNADHSHTCNSKQQASSDPVLQLATLSAPLSPQKMRSHEASVIRSHLEEHDLAQQQLNKSSPLSSSRANTNNANNTSLVESPPIHSTKSASSWAVEHHPLSLSRYQREFIQVRLLNSGSFGEVFHATSKVDLKDYAVKRVAFQAFGYSRDSLTQVIREVQCLAQCDHPNVVRYYTSWLEPSWMTGSGAAITTPTHGNEVRRQQKLLTDIQHMMIAGARSEEQSATSTSNHSESNHNNHLQDFFQGRANANIMRDRKFSIGSSLDSLDSAAGSSSYDETSGSDEEEETTWTIEQQQDCHLAFEDDDDSSFFFASSLGAAKDTSSKFASPPHHRFNNNNNKATQNTAKKTAARLKYRYQICLFIQMQLCQPATLGDWIRHRNSLVADPNANRRERVQTAVSIFGQIVSGLQHIHKKGIVHRDLKPFNLFRSLEEEGVFLIGDFGLSKLIHSATHQSSCGKKKKQQQHHHPEDFSLQTGDCNALVVRAPTELTAGVGTASYAAPEQVTTSTYGKLADVFSLGLILLELLCCFTTEHERMQTFYDCRHRRDIPSWITNEYPVAAQTILRCTEPNPTNRPTAGDLIRVDLLSMIETSDAKIPRELPPQKVPNDELLKLNRELEEKDDLIRDYEKKLKEKDLLIERLQAQLAAAQANHSADEVPQIQRVPLPVELLVGEGHGGKGPLEVESSSSSGEE